MPGQTTRRWFLSFTFVMLAANAPGMAADEGWTLVYQDNYDYASQDPNNTTFNTWMWREDCNGKHTFQDTQSEGCSAKHPCVKLTAEVYDAKQAVCNAALLPPSSSGEPTPYINAEMYNNACVRQGPGHPQPQDFDKLLTYGKGDRNPWIQTTILGTPIIPPFVMYQELRLRCDMPYPYDPAWQNNHPVTPYAQNSWNTTTPGALYANPLAYGTTENGGMWFRDLAWNAPYLADQTTSQKIEMRIKAEGGGAGTRGWGFWNTTMDPLQWQFAWFMEFINPVSADSKKLQKELLAMTVTRMDFDNLNAGGICTSQLPTDVYKWHDYSIIWSADTIEYRVDQQTIAAHSLVANRGMAFHNWVDNRNYSSIGPGNYPLSEPKSNIISSFAVYKGKNASSATPVTRAACMSWQTIVQKMLREKGTKVEKERAKKLATEIKSLRDLTALMRKVGL